MTLCPPFFQLIFTQIMWFWQEKIKTYGWSFSASQKVYFFLSYKDICDLHVELLSLQSVFESYATLTGKSESVSLYSLSTYHTGLYFPEMVGQCTTFSLQMYITGLKAKLHPLQNTVTFRIELMSPHQLSSYSLGSFQLKVINFLFEFSRTYSPKHLDS